MTSVAGASSLSLGSLYALMGLAMPSGAAGSGGVSPALAMLSAANESTGAAISALLGGGAAVSPSATGASLTTALLGLSTLDPAAELARLSGALGTQVATLAEGGG